MDDPPIDDGQMVVVSYGGGVDSTAMLIEMYRRQIIPDLILFADLEAEKPETYDFITVFDAWLVDHGMPEITVVRYNPTTDKYRTLQGNMLSNQTIPSPAFGMHSCSLKWKVQPQDYYLKGCSRGPNKREPHPLAMSTWQRGQTVLKVIGYDNSKADLARARKAERHSGECELFDYWYPLQDWEMQRLDCIRTIKTEGLPVPVKSACYFCPSSKKYEILWLAAKHPTLLWQAIAMEDGFRCGKWYVPDKKTKTEGLGRNWSWRSYLEDIGVIKDDEVVMPEADIMELAASMAPPDNTNIPLLNL